MRWLRATFGSYLDLVPAAKIDASVAMVRTIEFDMQLEIVELARGLQVRAAIFVYHLTIFGYPVALRRIAPTLLSPISMPSLRSSPWIRGAPHSRFSRLIFRISSRVYRRSSRSSAPELAGPEQLKTLPIPGNHGIAFHDDQRRVPVAPNPAQPSPKEPVCDNLFRPPLGGALEDADLMSKGDILQLQGGSRFQ